MCNILIIALCGLIFINVPIALSMGAASFLAIGFGSNLPIFVAAQRIFNGMDSFVLLAIPLFMIAGRLMEVGGISKRLIDLAMSMIGRVYGGLGMAAVVACMFFAAISGSGPATVAAIGSIMLPYMIKEGYDKTFAAALLASAGIIGMIIPPSIPFVTYGVVMSTSIGDLFIAGILPGILLGCSLMLLCYFHSRKKGYRGSQPASVKRFLQSLKSAFWGLLMPVIILGGIYGGFFTPTEAAGVSCVYSIIVGKFIYKELTYKGIFDCFWQAGILSAMVMLIIGAATAMGWILTAEQMPQKIVVAISSVIHSRWLLLCLLNIILLVTGCFMEPNAAIIILGPVFFTLLQAFDINLLHFGVVMVVNLSIGTLTPPLGACLFVGKSLDSEITFNNLVRQAIPMILLLIVDLFILTYIPAISLVLLGK